MIGEKNTMDTAEAFDANVLTAHQLRASELSANGLSANGLGANGLGASESDEDGLPDVSAREIEERIEDVNAQIEQEKLWGRLRRRAMDLEKLKLANRARRCGYSKANGEQCRAPAWGSHLFCAFHVRAMQEADGPRMKVRVLADRQSIQLTLKQIMEQIVTGLITPQMAGPLLRAAYIAVRTLKAKPVKTRRGQALMKTAENDVDEFADLRNKTDEEIEAELRELRAELKPYFDELEAKEASAETKAHVGTTPEAAGVDPGKPGVNPEENLG